jgi:hypothetical protein
MDMSDDKTDRKSIIENYDDPDPETRAMLIAAKQTSFDGWVTFGWTNDRRLAKAGRELEKAGVFASARASTVLPFGRGKAYRLVH